MDDRPPPPDSSVLDMLEASIRSFGQHRVWRALVLRRRQERATPADHLRHNVRGARWNPASVPAIYTSLEKETAAAEAANLSGAQARPLRLQIAPLLVRIEHVADLTDLDALSSAGISKLDIEGSDHAPCRRIGYACSSLGAAGLLVPSARRWPEPNLVIFPANLAPNELIEPVSGAT